VLDLQTRALDLQTCAPGVCRLAHWMQTRAVGSVDPAEKNNEKNIITIIIIVVIIIGNYYYKNLGQTSLILLLI